MNGAVYLGIDLGGTHLRIGRWCNGRLLEAEVLQTAHVFAKGDPALALARCVQGLYPQQCFRAVGLGLPSLLNRDRTVVLDTPNLPALAGPGVRQVLQKAWGVPVWMDRDVNMLLRYDLKALRLPPADTVVGIYVGTGIGNAISIAGRIHVGRNGCAGELGHVPTGDQGQACCCGNYGCAETVASGKYLARAAAACAPETPVDQIFVRHAGEPWLRGFIRQLALPIAAEVNILDPDYVVLGGGVINMPEFPRERLEREILAHVRRPCPAQGLRFRYSAQDQTSGICGAAAYAQEKMEEMSLTERMGT